MSAIERGDVSDAESFGCRDHGSRSERETATSRDEFSNSHPVAGRNLFSKEVASTLAVRSPGFGRDSPPAAAISTKPSSGTGVRRSSKRCKAPASLTVSQRAPTPQGYAGVSTRKRYQRSMMSSLFADTMLNHGDCCS